MACWKILYFAAETWTDIAKRNQSLAIELSRDDRVSSVLYVNPPVFSSVNDVVKAEFEPSDLGKDRSAHAKAISGQLAKRVTDKIWTYTGSRKTVPLTRFARVREWRLLQWINLRIYTALIRRSLDRLAGGKVVVWVSHPFHAFALKAFSDVALVVYDWIDDWECFDVLPVKDPRVLADLNDSILREADVVFAVSQRLWQRAKEVNRNTFRLPNATAGGGNNLCGASECSVAAELDRIPHPRLGYVGQIGDRFAFSLVHSLALARPNWSLVLVGPVWQTHEAELANFEGVRNVYFVGRRSSDQMPGLLAGFDVCIIPHLVNRLTLSMDPLKLYEYLSTGKPIVSTSVAGIERFRDVIYVGDTADEFLNQVEMSLTEDSAMSERRLTYAQQNTWTERAAQAWRALETVLEQKDR